MQAVSRDSQWKDPFQDLIRFRAGTREGYIYFVPDASTEEQSTPVEPFVALQPMDGSDKLILMELSRSVPRAPRAEFDGSVADDPALPENTMTRLRDYEGFWSNLPDPEPAVRGDTVTILDEPEGAPFVNTTTMGQPKLADGISLRLPVRVVARYDAGPRDYFVEAQLSTQPDSLGGIHHVTPVLSNFSANSLTAGSINLNNMVMGEVREGFLYFAPNEEQGYTKMPDEPFSILWYGPDRLEIRVDLNVSRQ